MFFQFESDFVDSLRCIPMQVRYKLDTCGVKLKLAQWNAFTQVDRTVLVDMPCDSESEIQTYRDRLRQLIQERTQTTASELAIDPQPAWLNPTTIPEAVLIKAHECAISIPLEQWAALQPLQRFALIKLSRSSHENSNFLPALKEFNLVQ